MYILYIDESGEPHGSHYVTAGMAVFERQEYWFATKVEDIQKRHFPHATEQAFFHLRDIVKGAKPLWNRVNESKRQQIIGEMYDILAQCVPPAGNSPPNAVLFGIVVETEHYLCSDIVATSFERLCYLFDSFLIDRYKRGDRQKGLVVLSKPQFEQKFAELLATYAKRKQPWGPRNVINLLDVPLFTASRASRLLQLADFVAGAIYQSYVHGDQTNMNKILPAFGPVGPTHNYLRLLHLTDATCNCQATH